MFSFFVHLFLSLQIAIKIIKTFGSEKKLMILGYRKNKMFFRSRKKLWMSQRDSRWQIQCVLDMSDIICWFGKIEQLRAKAPGKEQQEGVARAGQSAIS